MKKLTNFNDYLFDYLFEEKIELSIIISDRLNELLIEINHPIAFELLKLKREDIKSDKVAFIDYDNENKGNFTYIIPSKFLDIYKSKYTEPYNIEKIINYDNKNLSYYTSNYLNDVWSKFRMSTSINKVVNKLLPGVFKASGDPGNDLESFKNMVIAKREEKSKIFERIKIVSGADVNKYYSQYNYDMGYGKGTLTQSCMRYDSINFFMDFYSENGVKLVVLFSDKNPDKIIGRALLWDIEYIDGKKVDRKFMDRIYTIKNSHVDVFKEYAVKNKWLFKSRQNMDEDTYIIDPLNNITDFLTLKTKSTFKKTEYFPYLDTLKYFYYDEGFLSNSKEFYNSNINDYYYLSDTDGGPDNYYEANEDELQYVEYYGNWYDPQDLIWCNFGEEYRLPEDAVEIDHSYATEEYANDNLEYSDYSNEYLFKKYAVYSDFHKSYIDLRYSIKFFKPGASNYNLNIILNDDKYSDYIDSDEIENMINKDKIIKYNNNNIYQMFFSIEDIDNFVFCKLLSGGYKMAHKKWDKDKIFTIDNEYYFNDSDRSFKNYEMDAIFPFKK